MGVGTATTALPQYISISAFCEHASITDSTCRKWLSEGIIRGFKVGSTVRIPVTELVRAFQPIEPKH